jgi:hypothetical protein
MSFGLKNAGATYQRAIQACFKRQLNKNVEAYVDDVVVKTRKILKRSSPILKRLSHPFESTAGSSTRTSASLAYRWENYSASSSAIAASKPTPRRSPPSPT